MRIKVSDNNCISLIQKITRNNKRKERRSICSERKKKQARHTKGIRNKFAAYTYHLVESLKQQAKQVNK